MRAVSFHAPVLCLEGGLTVRAVFDHAWHLHDERGAVVTVTTAPYDGPMAIRVEGRLMGTARPGMRGRLAGRTLIVGPVSMALAGAREWHGERVDMLPVDAEALGRDLERIRLLAGVRHPVVSRRVAALGEALASGEEGALRVAVRGMIGLGPGLTPAGDDVLCGAMVGLRVFERRLLHGDGLRAKALGYVRGDAVERVAGCLISAVGEEMEGRTTALSRTLLWWAARGVAVQPLLDVLWTLGSGEPLEGLETVAAIGHTSGRDMLAGAALAAASVLGGQDDAPLVRATQHLP